MSVNGSPLANPFDLGLSWLAATPGKDGDRDEDDYSDGDGDRSGRGGESETSKGGNGKRAERIRTNSILVRRADTSFNSSVASSSSGHIHHPPAITLTSNRPQPLQLPYTHIPFYLHPTSILPRHAHPTSSPPSFCHGWTGTHDWVQRKGGSTDERRAHA